MINIYVFFRSGSINCSSKQYGCTLRLHDFHRNVRVGLLLGCTYIRYGGKSKSSWNRPSWSLRAVGAFWGERLQFLICLQDSDHSDAEANVTEHVNSTTDVSFTASEPWMKLESTNNVSVLKCIITIIKLN